MKPGIKIFAPATVANVACGFDTLGFALEHPGDEIIATFSNKPGIRITEITGAKGKLPYEVEKNTAGLAALRLLEHLGETGIGIELKIHKKMPFGSGLGSSAASAVAGVMAVNELLRKPLSKRELLPFAAMGEELASGSLHVDNVAPSLIGGMIFIRDNATFDVHRLPIVHGLHATVIYPEVNILTKDARRILSPKVALKDAITQGGNLGGLIIGFYKSDVEMIRRSLQDVMIESQRSHLIPQFQNIKDAALEADALGCSISGAGPSIFALSANSFVAENVRNAMTKIYTDAKIKHKVYVSKINHEGAVKC